MSNQTTSKPAGAGLLVAITASLCCITPVLALFSGVSGIAATFSWMEPFRPYLIGLTVAVLGFAWYQKLKPRSREEIECDCDEDGKEPFIQSKKFLGIVTVFAAIMLAFPGYSHIFYGDNTKELAITETSSIKQIKLDIEGMTCASCNEHVEHAANEVPGVFQAQASYETGTALIKFDESVSSADEIIAAVNETGYKVVGSEVRDVEEIGFAGIITPLSSKINRIELAVEGMTCTGCEDHVKHTVSQLDGVMGVSASYEEGKAIVDFDETKTSRNAIVSAINESGYKVKEKTASEGNRGSSGN